MKAVLFVLLSVFGQQRHQFLDLSGKITPTQIHALVLAVEDEIYDYGFEEDYVGIGANEGLPGAKWVSRMPIYIDPKISGGVGRAIYNFKHYGEVDRAFYFRNDGVVVLDGDAWNEFPPSEESFRTEYISRKLLARLKRDWLHESFVIDTNPDIKMVRQAAAREKDRTGTSSWESEVLPHLSQQ